jgi:hypothetical protein
MYDARRSEGGIFGILQGNIVTDANHAGAFENEIKLVLPPSAPRPCLARLDLQRARSKSFTTVRYRQQGLV